MLQPSIAYDLCFVSFFLLIMAIWVLLLLANVQLFLLGWFKTIYYVALTLP
ncbi:hypothetical protein HanXRQr2_Chr16g0756111 [Helianthus annuus]|uniref:Uncharacterized protein n=1 Tax=Helianthus annuus TaxID=4232 RepID=A0A9K3DUE8_HELAN|nr:hypothetical protein HanXRQr2_Chr16g0756111 [Helianthus annuus]KAJ0438660.1 hypothetical protein HanHA300_Chr16g0616581 [Helianthus annuus]KAJ0443512.1 hypothetical protein HanIR_Chr16g0821571 [Helianthus annuus]KAJ0461008.1 hypothetical protein HanHA89_Chr16g0667441 [Helianthus annuus]KAJ0641435.1 hypothetical protein HanLR1_Chr16g0627171 [Helianthus annuus]